MTLDTSINNSSILYELSVYSEWFQENDGLIRKYPHSQQSPSLWSAVSALNPLRIWRKSLISFDVKSVTDLSWKFAVSQDGMVAAILQESLLEIRTVKDGYISVVGKANVPNDSYPQIRRLAWSPDSTAIAVARDNGSVYLYNLLGSNLSSFPAPNKTDEGILNPVIGLAFLNSKFNSTKWSSELLTVHFDGTVRSYLLSALDGHASEESIKFSLSPHYPKGLTAAVYHPSHHMLIVAGYHCCGKGQNGISAWRILNDFPYLKLSFSSTNCDTNRSSIFRLLPSMRSVDPIVINRMRVSPNGRYLACLHGDGSVSFWTLPAIQLERLWRLEEQLGYSVGPTEAEKSEKMFWPVDVDWWSDEAIVLVRKCGAVTVCSSRTMENLLGEAPEVLSGPPQVAAVVSDRPGVLILDCEVHYFLNNRYRSITTDDVDQSIRESEEEDEASILQETIQAALYTVTDIQTFQPKKKIPKLVQKTYRLVGLKTVTPEELYTRKIDNGAYSDALTLAQTYNLDSDLVYQQQWRMNPVSSATIADYLGKVSKTLWVANECIQRVPEVPEVAAELLKFGLSVTNVNIPKDIAYENLTQENQTLISYRLKILQYMDTLTLYEKILGSQEKYDSSEYDELRKMGPLEAAVKFAREERWEAVSILLTYRSSAVLPHWLPVLSNLPETLRPSQYRTLLPAVRSGKVITWEPKSLRPPDWAEVSFSRQTDSDDFSDDLYDEDPNLRQFYTLEPSVALVAEWYRMRAYQIEQYTGLVEHALALIRLARERNIPKLDKLYFDLLTLDSLVSNVGDDSTTLATINNLSHFEQAKLLLGRTNPSSFVVDVKNHLLQFILRCEDQGCHDKFSLIRQLLLFYSSTSLRIPLELLRHLKEHQKCELYLAVTDVMTLALDCLYACPQNDELENSFFIFECLPDRIKDTEYSEEEEKLHSRIDILEKHLTICEILEQCNSPRSLKYVLENVDNKEVAKELMEVVATHAQKETLDFSGLIDDLLTMQQVFACVEKEVCYEISVLAQMTCDCEEIIQSADQHLTCWTGESWKVIPFQKSLQLVLQAARIHFEKSLSFEDPSLKLAQTCLSLISEPHPEICQEMDLIEAVHLMGDFDVKILPLQVKISSNKYALLEKCLNSSTDAYKACQRLIQLAHALHLEGDDRIKREGEVLLLVANHSFGVGDYSYCSEVCGRLISRNYAPAWEIVQKLGRCEKFLDTAKRRHLLAFAILHCPIESLEPLIESRVELRENIFPSIAAVEILSDALSC